MVAAMLCFVYTFVALNFIVNEIVFIFIDLIERQEEKLKTNNRDLSMVRTFRQCRFWCFLLLFFNEIQRYKFHHVCKHESCAIYLRN